MRRRPRSRTTESGGFTLLELMIVMVVISIIVGFILSAAMGANRRADERATQALIAKLEAGVADRIDAILSQRIDANPAHVYLADSVSSSLTPNTSILPTAHLGLSDLPSITRAQVIARLERMMSELPDVFIVQGAGGTADGSYPLNFGAAPFSSNAGTALLASPYAYYMLPFGVAVSNDPLAVGGSASFGANPPINFPYTSTTPVAQLPTVTPESTGIFGASYTASAGIYKNLVAAAIKNGATPPSPIDRGYNGIDDDNNGFVDDLGENGASVKSAILLLLANHTHKTARSEMLYALLVEGQGPLGSVFTADDFRDNEVRDTDGDGLPEFIDAWGEPIQFYRWPIGFVDDTGTGLSTHGQKGFGTYQPLEPRQQNALDPNQQLVNPAWWDGTFNDSSPFALTTSTTPLSGAANAVQTYFTLLIDPNAGATGSAGLLWNRGTMYGARRAFQSRFLILSGGPDKIPGVPVLDQAYYTALADYTNTAVTGTSFSGASPVAIATTIEVAALSSSIIPLRIEGQAAQATFLRANSTYYTLAGPQLFPGSDTVSLGIREAGNDDITNHNLQGPGGATQ